MRKIKPLHKRKNLCKKVLRIYNGDSFMALEGSPYRVFLRLYQHALSAKNSRRN